ncbi:MAG: hypothetical protein ABIN89_03010 [Chitinophagaceae bacterium]
MSKCSFIIPVSGNSQEILAKAKMAIEKQGGVFTGDHLSGNFNVNVLGNITGTYTITGQEMFVDILSKPIFIPCSQIESFMRSQLVS